MCGLDVFLITEQISAHFTHIYSTQHKHLSEAYTESESDSGKNFPGRVVVKHTEGTPLGNCKPLCMTLKPMRLKEEGHIS